jgi:hypothetical protein
MATNVSSTCVDHLLWPGTQVCDAAGECLPTGFCLCNTGWSGSGDFTPLGRNEHACDINETVVRVAWCVVAVLYATVLPFVLNVMQFEISLLLKSKGRFSDGQKMVAATKLAA